MNVQKNAYYEEQLCKQYPALSDTTWETLASICQSSSMLVLVIIAQKKYSGSDWWGHCTMLFVLILESSGDQKPGLVV